MRSIAVRADPLYPGGQIADVVVSSTALGYNYTSSCCVVHPVHMTREQLLDLVVVASRLLDAWPQRISQETSLGV
jgi:hypothetical protein